MLTATTVRANALPILLVDDSKPFRTRVRKMLDEYAAFTVVGEAGDGLMAIELALSLIPQVVIMDVNMPRLGGIEATRRIKQVLPGVHVIGFSLNHDERTQVAMKAAGSTAFLSKGCAHQLPHLIGLITGSTITPRVELTS